MYCTSRLSSSVHTSIDPPFLCTICLSLPPVFTVSNSIIATMVIEDLLVVFGGELAKDVAERVAAKKPPGSTIQVTLRNASGKPQQFVDLGPNTCVCFVMQTVENSAPAEDVSVKMTARTNKIVQQQQQKNRFTHLHLP